MSLSKIFVQQSRDWIFGEMIAGVLFIGALDFITGYQIRVLPFYSAPIFVAAWFCRQVAMYFCGHSNSNSDTNSNSNSRTQT